MAVPICEVCGQEVDWVKGVLMGHNPGCPYTAVEDAILTPKLPSNSLDQEIIENPTDFLSDRELDKLINRLEKAPTQERAHKVLRHYLERFRSRLWVKCWWPERCDGEDPCPFHELIQLRERVQLMRKKRGDDAITS